jgi:hypothetical protein
MKSGEDVTIGSVGQSVVGGATIDHSLYENRDVVVRFSPRIASSSRSKQYDTLDFSGERILRFAAEGAQMRSGTTRHHRR